MRAESPMAKRFARAMGSKLFGHCYDIASRLAGASSGWKLNCTAVKWTCQRQKEYPGMSIDISSKNEARLRATAQAEGVSVDAYVERLMNEREELAAIVTRAT